MLANLLLVALLVMTLRRDRPVAAAAAAAPGATSDGAGGATAIAPVLAPELQAACDELAAGSWTLDAAALVLRAGTAVCGASAPAVTELITSHLTPPAPPIDAGVPVDASPPIDARKRRSN